MILQVSILITSVVGLFLQTSTSRRERLVGYCAALFGQPAWIWVTWSAGQWGMLATTCIYTVLFMRGIRSNYYDRG